MLLTRGGGGAAIAGVNGMPRFLQHALEVVQLRRNGFLVHISTRFSGFHIACVFPKSHGKGFFAVIFFRDIRLAV